MPTTPEKHAAYMRERYRTDPEFRARIKKHTLANKRKHRAANKALVDAFKAQGCMAPGCKEKAPCCMVAHHLDPASKSFELARHSHRSLEKIQMELEKCVCLCMNCHAKVHAGLLVLN